jgi:hypothetical protein
VSESEEVCAGERQVPDRDRERRQTAPFVVKVGVVYAHLARRVKKLLAIE